MLFFVQIGMKMKQIFILLTFITFAYSCSNSESDKSNIEEELIINYIAQNNLAAFHYSDGLYYSIENETPQKDYPSINSTIKVNYKGYLLNGTVVDSSNNKFINVNLRDCIEGWQLGIPLFSNNSKGKLFIPSSLAFGASSTPQIPPFSILIYEIELKEFKDQ